MIPELTWAVAMQKSKGAFDCLENDSGFTDTLAFEDQVWNYVPEKIANFPSERLICQGKC